VGGPDTIEIIASAASEADLAYIPTPHDAHQVHVAAATAALTAVRRTPNILHYEGPSSHHFSPNSFVELNADALARKHQLLEKHASQVSLGRLDPAKVDIVASYRGLQAGLTHAEGFEVNRIRWTTRPRLP
jgi:LmbE family N-acetylglucosaminyl deacetylase